MKKQQQRFCSEHEDRPAVLYCSHASCEKFFCEECEKGHSGMNYYEHKNCTSKDISTDRVFAAKCKKHPDFQEDFLCKTHWELCCAECNKDGGDHHGCIVVPFKNINMEQMRNELTKAELDYKDKLNQLNGLPLNDLKESNEKFYTECEKTKKNCNGILQ